MINQVALNEETQRNWDFAIAKSILDVPFYTYEWHSVYFSTTGEKEIPFILHLPELSVIAPFAKNESTISFVGPEITDYSDIIGTEEQKESAWNELLPYLKENGIQTINLTNVPESSITYSYFLNHSKERYAIEIKQRDTTPKIILPQDFDSYCHSLSRKERHELKRKNRRFIHDYPDAMIHSSNDIKNDIEILIDLMLLDERKKQFFTPENLAFFRALPVVFPEKLILQILMIDNQPATAILAFKTAQSFFLYNSGFDQSKFPGAGFHLKAESIRYALENHFEEYNFLRGNERYKYDLGGKDFAVFDISIKFF